ncbi:zinc ribbon domain-containing protein [Patescibacteria group bacterium]|nr:zinc ribbon domain-containing protein [Patescibacteria group bacterium]MCL5798142.1 zinc ribbon domain-containing protein [Patescibacteria group bacterium]
MNTSDTQKQENIIISPQTISSSQTEQNALPQQKAFDSKSQQICPFCHTRTLQDYFFCQNCGSKLKQKPLSVSIGKQITVYLVSILLPPLGYIWGYKYLRQEGTIAKKIGIAAIILTTVSIILSLWATQSLVNSINQALNKQMAPYQNLGY